MSYWEEAPGQTQDSLEGLFFPLGWERFGISQEALESVAGGGMSGFLS